MEERLKEYFPEYQNVYGKKAPYIVKILEILAENKNLTIIEARQILNISSDLINEIFKLV